MYGAVVSSHVGEEYATPGTMRVEIGGGTSERDDPDESHGGEGRLDPHPAERGEEECEASQGLGYAWGSMEQEEGRSQQEKIVLFFGGWNAYVHGFCLQELCYVT